MAYSGNEHHPGWRDCPAGNQLRPGNGYGAEVKLGALVAFTFVNLSVISQFWIREKRNKTLKDHFRCLLFLPMCGALTVGALWVNLEESSMVLGLIWAAIGLIYLAYVPPRASVTRFRSTKT